MNNDRRTSIEPILAEAKPLVGKIENKDFETVRMEYNLIFDKKSKYRTYYKAGLTV